MQGITAELARFAVDLRYEEIPQQVRQNAVLAILDSIGTDFAGLQEPSARLIRDYALREGAAGDATIIGTGQTTSATHAALANGTAAHALDYDSISLTVSGFVASPTLFAILALAETANGKVSGKKLIEAFIAGWEVEAAIAAGVGVLHYSKGWHATATLGHFGAAVGAGKLLGLGVDEMQSCIGVAASEASGLRTMIGYMTNPFHVGKAARNGVTAAQLAGSGFQAAPDVIEHANGFAVAFNGSGGFDLDAMVSGLGSSWDLVDPGLVIKMYPCCGLIHSAIDAVLLLRDQQGMRSQDIASIEVAVHALVIPTMKFDRPRTGYEAKFSTPFCVAIAASEGAVKLEHFSRQWIDDPNVRELMDRVKMVVHPELTDRSTFLEREFTELTVELQNGKSLVRRVNRIDNRGSRGNPADLSSISEKFGDCTKRHPARERAREAFTRLATPESLDDIASVMEILR